MYMPASFYAPDGKGCPHISSRAVHIASWRVRMTKCAGTTARMATTTAADGQRRRVAGIGSGRAGAPVNWDKEKRKYVASFMTGETHTVLT